MIAPLLIALAAQTSAPPATARIIADAAHAIDAGRLDQARLMISRVVGAGANGAQIERLLANLAFASANYEEALSRYQHLRAGDAKDSSVCEPAAIAALKIGRLVDAAPLLQCATASAAPSWRSWNAQGVLADLNGDWSAADEAYGRAARLAPNQAEIINNQGWSLLMRGDWALAAGYFERAAVRDPRSLRIANNLELARAALQTDLPQRRERESDLSWAARLNDAGVAARLSGDRQRAIAAFTQAVEASGSWYQRAAHNLQAASQQ
jgi:Flp pilus assembly protein TadD